MKTIDTITLRPYTTSRTLSWKKADIVMDSHRDLLADYLSLGIVCLYKTITGVDKNIVKVAKRDYSTSDSGVTAYLEDKVIKIANDSLMDTACRYVAEIANFIAEREYINNMVLGPQLSMAVSLYLIGENCPMGIMEDSLSELGKILPSSWNMKDTVEAQKVAFALISRMFELTIIPFGF